MTCVRNSLPFLNFKYFTKNLIKKYLIYIKTFVSCYSFKREDSEIENSGNEDSDDSAAADDYQSKSKKPINKGRWSKEEVRLITARLQNFNTVNILSYITILNCYFGIFPLDFQQIVQLKRFMYVECFNR